MLLFVDKTILVRLRTFCFSDIIEKNIWKERERCFYKFIKQQGRNWNRNMSGYIVWYIWQSYFFEKNKDK